MKTLIFKKNKFIAVYNITMDTIGAMLTYFFFLLTPAIIFIMAYFDGGKRETPMEEVIPYLLTAIALFFLLVIIKFVRGCLFYKNQFYEISDYKITTKTGIYTKCSMDVSVRNIVTVYCEQSVLERLTKTATLFISTNATNDDYLVLEHINDFENIQKTIDNLRIQNY